MYTDDVPSHDIDLRRPESERWHEVIRRERATVGRLLRSMRRDMSPPVRALATLCGAPFRALYGLAGGRYLGELSSIAEDLDISASELLLVNCSYEISHALEMVAPFGCTAGVRWVPGTGLVHVRSMDWPVRQIGTATRLFRFKERRRRFVSVGILGHVGVLSGMVPRAYSVTLNWAPPTALPRFQWGPGFWLREVLATCDTYDEAVAALADAELATSVFYLVAGTKRGQACVVERTPTEAVVREMEGDVLTCANHHVADELLWCNEGIAEGSEEEWSLLDTSAERADVLERRLRRVRATGGLDGVAACLDVPPVLNADSYQQMAFCPRTGEVRVWRRVGR